LIDGQLPDFYRGILAGLDVAGRVDVIYLYAARAVQMSWR